MQKMRSNQSEVSRREIETKFGLVKPKRKKLHDALKIHPLIPGKLNSGKRSEKAAISNLFGTFILRYK